MRDFKQIPFTKNGYDKLKSELIELENQRPDAVETLARARAMGDLSENGLYKAARMRLSSIDHRIARLKALIKQAVITEPVSGDVVGIGTTLVVSHEKGSKKITIVGGYESNPEVGKISHLSPLGSVLMKKKAGDTVTVTAPVGEITYVIEKIL